MKRVFLALGLVLIIVLAAVLFFMKVRTTSCRTDKNALCPNPVLEYLNSYQGKRLFQIEQKIRNNLSREPEVQEYTVHVSPLGDLSVQLKLREANIALKPESTSTYTLYTKDGVLVTQASETSLPIVVLKEQILPEMIPFVATLSYQITTILPVSQMTVEGESLKVILRDNRIVYYPLSGDIDLLLGTTLVTFSQLNLTDGKLIIDRQAVAIHEIDLRFKNPVLR